MLRFKVSVVINFGRTLLERPDVPAPTFRGREARSNLAASILESDPVHRAMHSKHDHATLLPGRQNQCRSNGERNPAPNLRHPNDQLTPTPSLPYNPAHSAEHALLDNHFVTECVIDALRNSFWRRAIALDRVTQECYKAVGK